MAVNLLASLATSDGDELVPRAPCEIIDGSPWAQFAFAEAVPGIADAMVLWCPCGEPVSVQQLSGLVVFDGEDAEVFPLPLALGLPEERGRA